VASLKESRPSPGSWLFKLGQLSPPERDHASLCSVGLFSNLMLLWGIAFELLFAAALVYVPFLQDVFGTAALGTTELALLASFPLIVWSADELRRVHLRRRAS
jgi:hypothetical protein